MGIIKKLTGAEEILTFLERFRRDLMATLEQFQQALAQVDAETTRIGEYIESILAQLNRDDLTKEQEAEVLASLQVAADRLKAVGTSVEEPIPDEPLPEL